MSFMYGSAICKGARQEALEETPELLPVLKKAGFEYRRKGLCYIFDGMI